MTSMHLYNDNYSVLNGVAAGSLEVQDAMLTGYGRHAGRMPLHTGAGFRILTWPSWNDESAAWEAPIRAYLATFRADDDVCLLLRFDPQTVLLPTEVIYQRIESMLPEYGLTDESMPELLLINDLLDNELQASLFNSVHAFLQNGRDVADTIHSARARETGLVIVPSEDVAALRRAYDQYSGEKSAPSPLSTMTQLASTVADQLIDQGHTDSPHSNSTGSAGGLASSNGSAGYPSPPGGPGNGPPPISSNPNDIPPLWHE